MAEIASLVRTRGVIKGKVTRLNTALNSYETNPDKDVLDVIYSKTLSAWEDFDRVSTELEVIDEENNHIHCQIREEFEIQYARVISKVKKILQSDERPTSSIESSLPSDIKVKLPQLSLPSFDGTYEQWTTFWDTFEALIHKNTKLSNIQKFYYLKTQLSGEARALVNQLSVTSENYEEAVTQLQARFQNKKLLIQNHLDAILKIPGSSKAAAQPIRALINTLSTNINALKKLSLPVDSWDTLIIHLVVSKLDFATREDWETEISNEDLPKLSQFKAFLENKCSILETMATSHKSSDKPNQSRTRTSVSHHITNQTCPSCSGSHQIYKCPQFMALDVQARFQLVKDKNLCINCLGSHLVRNCNSKFNCRTCRKRHHYLLHRQLAITAVNESCEETSMIPNNNNDFAIPSTSASVGTTLFNTSSSHVMLFTALVRVQDKHNNYHNCRCLLDPGSQISLITSAFKRKLQLPSRDINMNISGVNNTSSVSKEAAVIRFESLVQEFSAKLYCVVVPQITHNLPTFQVSSKTLKKPDHIVLADPQYNTPNPIDMLIGAELFLELLCIGQIQPGKGQPTWQKTKLGWIVGGKCSSRQPAKPQINHCHLTTEESVGEKLERFWKIETLHNTQYTDVESYSETHFANTFKRLPSGRFEVCLPFKQNFLELGTSKAQAIKRFLSVERRLVRDPSLKDAYVKFMSEYQSLGHMIYLGPSDNVQEIKGKSFYLPHHAVMNASSISTKVRVVFDGSAKSTTGVSLNDSLTVGPTIQDDLFLILTRFRTHMYAFTADIQKMYRQVVVNQSDSNFQRIVWRDSPDKPLGDFQLKTVTYGTASAPFLAIRCLNQLAKDASQQFPLAARIISRDFYVDDLVSGSNDLQEAKLLLEQITKILSDGKFPLTKFASNCEEIIPSQNDDTQTHFDKHGESKTLGLLWQHKPDILKFSTQPNLVATKWTKRNILSTIAQIFDPLGLIGPIIVLAKIILQELWSEGLKWDESIPISIHTKWAHFIDQVPFIANIQIPRLVIGPAAVTYEVHGFSDASEAAYGACLYLRTISQSTTHCHLICSKSRVAPLKRISLPRLELCGAVLLAELGSKVIPALNLKISKIKYWTDSQIVLAWLNADASRWTTFVANRITIIQNLSTVIQWSYVPSKSNPADVISRGLSADKLIQSNLWFHGPEDFLTNNLYVELAQISVENMPEVRKGKVAMPLTASHNVLPLEKYSSFTRLQRTVAYVLRFIFNCKYRHDKRVGNLTNSEVSIATNLILAAVQREVFHKEHTCLTQGLKISRTSKLLPLNPFIDTYGLIRVGGRLRHACLDYNTKHPIVLPQKHHVTKIIVRQVHYKQLHAGPEATLAAVRQNFWPISGRSIVKKVIHNCIACYRSQPKCLTEIMGDLPKQRVVPNPPFSHCGVDYAGPLSIRESRRRGRPVLSKAYIALFICLVTKAVHIEIVSDLTTAAFIAALRRFVARRGLVSHIYSDNGTTFIGANSELKKLSHFARDRDIQNHVTEMKITWHFIPPRAPHFGGLWEANIKSFKTHLKRVVGNVILTFEELYTIATQIEACLNSRPLIPLSETPNDLDFLTPGHFLVGRALAAPLDDDLEAVPISRLSRWQHLQQMTQHLWKRWSTEYLTQLQSRYKWQQSSNTNIVPGMVVLVRNEQLPPMQWPLGRIVETFPGKDNIVRTVTIKTKDSVIKRPIVKICILPVDQQN